MEQIVRVREAHEDGTATVFLQRESACSGDCHKCSGCGAAKEVMIFEVQNPIGARRGDLVIIESKSGPVMKAVGVFYVLPLVLFFLGYFVMPGGETPRMIAGGAAFVVGIVICMFVSRSMKKNNKEMHFAIVEVLE